MSYHNAKHPSPAAKTDLGPADEVGVPDSKIAECDCGVLFPRGDWHRCEDTGERVEWEDYADE